MTEQVLDMFPVFEGISGSTNTICNFINFILRPYGRAFPFIIILKKYFVYQRVSFEKFSVKRSVVDGFGDMLFVYFGSFFEVCYSSRNLYNT